MTHAANSSKPLQGMRVVITRAQENAGELSDAFRAKGAEPLCFPCITRRFPDDLKEVHEAWHQVEAYDRVLVGSVAALDVFRTLTLPAKRAPITCVGAKTAEKIEADEALRARFVVHEVADVRRAEGVIQSLLGIFTSLEGRRFLWPRAREAREKLRSELSLRGATVDPLVTYILDCADYSPSEQSILASASVFTFLSGRTLECFLRMLGANGRAHLERATVAVIGPVAQECAYKHNIKVDVVPDVASGQALVEALSKYFA